MTAPELPLGLLPDHLTPEEAQAVAAVVRLAVARRTARLDSLVLAVRHFRLLALAAGASNRGIAAGERLLSAEDRAAIGLVPLAIPLVSLQGGSDE